jgi:uncharacterized protein (DUF1499 family)
MIRWFTRNVASSDSSTHADVGPLELPGGLADSIKQIERTVGQLRRWKVVSTSENGLHLTRTTRVFRFVDDIRVTLTPHGTVCLAQFESKSRVGVGDLGQNRRNILELQRALRKAT